MFMRPIHDRVAASARRESLLTHYDAGALPPAQTLPLVVSLERLTQFDALGTDWRGLEASASGSFFITWKWIDNWIATLPPGVELWALRACRAGLVMGLAVLTRHARHLGGLLPVESWWLHATGREECDVLFIEHNDFLVHQADSAAIRRAMLTAWSRASKPNAELHLPGVRAADWAFLEQAHLGQRHRVQISYALDARLEGRGAPEDHTALLGAHTRRMVRRSCKEYEKHGPISVEEAASKEESLAWFEALLMLNSDRHASKGSHSKCLAPHFRRFHIRLLEQATEGVRMVRVSTENQVIAYLYAFIQGERAYVYQSGLDFSNKHNNARPGYVGHILTAAAWARQGVHVYDFMAGEARYKENLSNRQDKLDWVVLHKNDLSHRLEDHWLDVKCSAVVRWLRARWTGSRLL
jgi:CelD/BcsL family acetyltransferase involved in cellulose biosynthesis